MTENEAQKWLEIFEWDDSEETSEALATICEALQEYTKFKAIGTIEEFKALKEKSVAKKPEETIKNKIGFYHCPNPNCKRLLGTSIITRVDKYCADCGQALTDY